MTEVTCAICEGPVENAHLCDPAHDWICTPCDIAENTRAMAATTCDCGQPKSSGEGMCAACAYLEQQEEGRDHEEEARQTRLLAALPDGLYTASELREYLE